MDRRPIVRLRADDVDVASLALAVHVEQDGRCQAEGLAYPCWMARWGLAVYDRHGRTPPTVAGAPQ